MVHSWEYSRFGLLRVRPLALRITWMGDQMYFKRVRSRQHKRSNMIFFGTSHDFQFFLIEAFRLASFMGEGGILVDGGILVWNAPDPYQCGPLLMSNCG